MRNALRNLQVDELIVHDIPRQLSKRILRESGEVLAEQPVFSQIASPVNDEIINFFHDRISDTIGSSNAVDIIFDPTNESSVRTLISEYFTSNVDRRIYITQQIAQHLFNIQNAQNPGGLLLFVRCSLRERAVLAILKVEREEGVRVKQQMIRDGLMTFDIEHIRDLMLTKRTKLFKIVLFYIYEQMIKGILCDQQIGYGRKDVADFFLSDFLGCMLTEEPQILTKRYFEATQKYINERLNSPEQKGEMLSHLVSELTNQNRIVNPTEFARRVLPVDRRDDYIRFIQENGAVIGNFMKECSMIENKLKRIQYDFDSGISVFGSQEAISSKSRVVDLEDGKMRMEIIDHLKQVRTK